jgi:APA family basic amino acid/polyamine antiporter
MLDQPVRAEVPPAGSPGVLPRVLGPYSAIAVVVGSIIGSGIYLKPSSIAQDLPYVGAIIGVWVTMGVVILFGALALAELAAMLPHAGGPFVYLREAYGRMPAFLWGWTEFWVIRTGSLGALAAATAIYLSKFLEASDLAPLGIWEQAGVSLALVAGVSTINIFSTKWGAGLQNLTVVIKVGFLVALIVLPYALGEARIANAQPLFPAEASRGLFSALGLAAIAVLWPYDGWINIGPVAEEIHHPQRNIPLALMVGMAIVIAVYVLVNVSYHLVLTVDEVAGSQAVAADVCQRLFGARGAQIIALGVMCSTFGAVNSNAITGPRIYFAMARDGMLPGVLHRVHPRWQTPVNAIAMQAVWSLLLIVGAYAYTSAQAGVSPDGTPIAANPVDAFDALTNFVTFGGYIFYAMAVAAVFVLRRTRPDLPRPYRTWGYPFTPAIYLVAFAALLSHQFATNQETSMLGLALIAAGAVYYWIVLPRLRDPAP